MNEPITKEQWVAERAATLELECFSNPDAFALAINISSTHGESSNIHEFMRVIAVNSSEAVLLAACNDLRIIHVRVINRYTKAIAHKQWSERKGKS